MIGSKVKADCGPCLLNRALSALDKSGANEEVKFKAMLAAIENLHRGFNPSAVPAFLEYTDMQTLKSMTGNADPYKEVKALSMSVAERFAGGLNELVSRGGLDAFKALVRLAVAANGLEFDVQGYQFKEDLLMHPPELSIDESPRLWKDLLSARRVAFVLDNVGEHVFDLALVKFMANYARVDVYAKKIPLLNDVTEEELRFDVPADFRAYYYEPRAVGFTWDGLEAKDYDFLLAKGMANYETLTEGEPPLPVYHALMAKCRPIADSLGVPIRSGVLIRRDRASRILK